MTINRGGEDNIGLFGEIDGGATIENVQLIDVDINGKEDVGSLVGNNYGTVNNSTSSGSVNGSSDNVGGLVGYNKDTGTVSNSTSSGSVYGSFNDDVGGLVGFNYASGRVSDSSSNCSVYGSFNSSGF